MNFKNRIERKFSINFLISNEQFTFWESRTCFDEILIGFISSFFSDRFPKHRKEEFSQFFLAIFFVYQFLLADGQTTLAVYPSIMVKVCHRDDSFFRRATDRSANEFVTKQLNDACKQQQQRFIY